MTILRSNGENEARAYARADVRSATVAPVIDVERVQIVDPRHTSTVRTGARGRRSAPRNVEQRVCAQPRPAGIELPDGRPATKAQRVFIAPELAARWRAEAREEARAEAELKESA